jgi:hypothetical protein
VVFHPQPSAANFPAVVTHTDRAKQPLTTALLAWFKREANAGPIAPTFGTEARHAIAGSRGPEKLGMYLPHRAGIIGRLSKWHQGRLSDDPFDTCD